MVIIVNVIRLRDLLHLNLLIIFPLIIQRRRKPSVCAVFVFAHFLPAEFWLYRLCRAGGLSSAVGVV